ncbi:hypothetical protein D3C71_1932760 [compost metagenome]
MADPLNATQQRLQLGLHLLPGTAVKKRLPAKQHGWQRRILQQGDQLLHAPTAKKGVSVGNQLTDGHQQKHSQVKGR